MGATVRTDPSAGVAQLLLDDHAHRNPLDHGHLDQLEAMLDDPGIDAIVIGSRHPGVFCSGGDLRLDDASLHALSERIYEFCWRALSASTVLIVAADGVAVGSGAQLFLAADLRHVGPRAVLKVADPGRGLVAGSWSLVAALGRPRALRVLLTGDPLTATDLVAFGLADRVDDDPVEAATDVATAVAALPAGYRTQVKRAVTESAFASGAALQIERAGFRPPARRPAHE